MLKHDDSKFVAIRSAIGFILCLILSGGELHP